MGRSRVTCAMLLLLLLSQGARAGELRRARPDRVGMSAERLERITALARDGRVIHEQQFGAIDFETGRPMPPDAIFRIYSMSKPVAAVALMMLFEEGRFLLGDPASKFIPELAGMKVGGVTEKDIKLAEQIDFATSAR